MSKHPFDEVLREMEIVQSGIGELFDNLHTGKYFPACGIKNRMLPAICGNFRVDVKDHTDEIIVTADLPGIEKKDIFVHLVNPRLLEISIEINEEHNTKDGDQYYLRERMYGTSRRTVPLPADVTSKDTMSTFKNGVLEIRLKKILPPKPDHIRIE